MNNLSVWTNTEFKGHWPVGTAAVVVADSPLSAAAMLNQKLLAHGLPAGAKPEQFQRLPTTHPVAIVLNDGDY